MATQFPLAPAAGQTFVLNGISYEYNAALGWVVPTTGAAGPNAPTTFTRGTAQFTDDAFGFIDVYDNIFDAYLNNTGIFRNPNNGNPAWNTTTYATTTWNGLRMLNVAPTTTGNPNLEIDIPAGAVGGLLWLRFIQNDTVTARENTFTYRAAGSGATGETFFNTWGDALTLSHDFGPHGYLRDAGGDYSKNHMWVPLVLPDGATTIEVELRGGTGWNAPDGWISGVAFTDNPRGWGVTNGITLHRQGSGFFYNNCFPWPWGSSTGGYARARFQGRNNDTFTTAPVNNTNGFKRFVLQCDINGNDKRVLFMTYQDLPNSLREPPYFRALNGTWMSPQDSVHEIDWMSLSALKGSPVFQGFWIYDIPAAEIAAAAAQNVAGGNLDTAATFEMFTGCTDITDIPFVFTYDV